MFPARLIPPRVAREFVGLADHLPRDNRSIGGGRSSSGLQARPGRRSSTVAPRSLDDSRRFDAGHEIEIGRCERVEPGNLMRLGRQRDQLFALSGREKVAAPGDPNGTAAHHSNAARLAYSIARIDE